MFRPHFNIVFFLGGGGGGGSISSEPSFSILKLDIPRAFFLTFSFKIVAPGWFKRQTPFGYFSNNETLVGATSLGTYFSLQFPVVEVDEGLVSLVKNHFLYIVCFTVRDQRKTCTYAVIHFAEHNFAG